MKAIVLITLAILGGSVLSQEGKYSVGGVMKDPRTDPGWFWPPEYLRDGEEVPDPRNFPASNAILIIARAHPRGLSQVEYEISGIKGAHTLERVEAFLKAYYAAPKGDEIRKAASNVIIVPDDWGSGIFLLEILKPLSKQHRFSVFQTQYAFTKIELIEEPAERLQAIQRAFEVSATK